MYHIIDEPLPSPLEKLVVNPMWPSFALMFAGSWLAFPWWICNAFALGSYYRRRTIFLSLAAFAGSAVLGFGLIYLRVTDVLAQASVPYFVLLIQVWKLGLGYVLFIQQWRTFQIFETFGGQVRNGLFFLILSIFVAQKYVFGFLNNDFWFLVFR